MPLLERHFSILEIAQALGLDPATVRKIFARTPGVVRFSNAKRRKRPYITMRIPQSVLERRLAELRAK